MVKQLRHQSSTGGAQTGGAILHGEPSGFAGQEAVHEAVGAGVVGGLEVGGAQGGALLRIRALLPQAHILGNPTPGTPHQHLKWALMPIGAVFRGPPAAGRSGAEARENRGTLGPQDSGHWAAARALAIANLLPMVV